MKNGIVNSAEALIQAAFVSSAEQKSVETMTLAFHLNLLKKAVITLTT